MPGKEKYAFIFINLTSLVCPYCCCVWLCVLASPTAGARLLNLIVAVVGLLHKEFERRIPTTA